jgi:hypothetical protein
MKRSGSAQGNGKSVKKRELTPSPAPRNDSTSGKRLFCSVTIAMSCPDFVNGLAASTIIAAVSSRLPLRVPGVAAPPPPPPCFPGARSASILKLAA